GTDSPSVALLREDDTVPPVRCTTGDNDPQLAAKITRPTSVGTCHVANADLNLLAGGGLVTQPFKPRRTVRAAASRVEDQVRMDDLDRFAVDTCSHTGHALATGITSNTLHGAILDGAYVRQCQQPTAQMALEHGTTRSQADHAALAVSQRDVMTYPSQV